MQKKILAMAVAGAFAAAPALASADDSVTLFGQVKYEVGAVDGASAADGGSTNRDMVHSGVGTRIGVRGSEDLGGGITGLFRIQGNLAGQGNLFNDPNTGAFDFNEEVWVGIDGNFGQVRLGQSDSAMKNAMKPFRAFTDTLADSATRPGRVAVAGQTTDSWTRQDGIHYQSPDFAGFTFGATLNPTGAETDAYYSLNTIYEMGPMQFSGAYERASSPNQDYAGLAGSFADVDSWHAGFSFDFGQGDVGVKYHQWDGGSNAGGLLNDNKLEQVLVPANFRVTDQINLRAAVQYNTIDDGNVTVGTTSESSWTNVAFGAQYHFSNRTEAFVNIWNDGHIGTTATTTGPNFNSDDGTHVGVGLRHSF
ncbi:porin [Thioalkalivibrio sp. ALgr3]|uniref:porin n=1 Tax=Thioalkalivibrio sp. ALgr3 TaxID=1239292 RepID=UPI000374566D|nr:porin [Thioalkalivibrio sp. ALgr3]